MINISIFDSQKRSKIIFYATLKMKEEKQEFIKRIMLNKNEKYNNRTLFTFSFYLIFFYLKFIIIRLILYYYYYFILLKISFFGIPLIFNN